MPADFFRMRSRWLIFWLAAFVGAILGFKEIFRPERELLAVVAELLFYGILGLWVWRQCAVARLGLPSLVGRKPKQVTPPQILFLTLALLVFSEGCFWLFWMPVSYVLPEFTTWWGLDALPPHWNPAAPGLSVCNFFLSILLAPIVEEMIFRGVLLHRWAAKWGAWPSLTATSVIFGALHSDVLGGIAFGYIMGFLVARTGGLWVPIAVHIANNAIAVSLEFAPDWTARPVELEAFRAQWPVGLVCLLLGAALLYRIRHLFWPPKPLTFPLSEPQVSTSLIAV